MSLSWGAWVDWGRRYDFSHPAANLWPDMVSMEWRLGMGRAYALMEEGATCVLTLRNEDGKYNPENPASPLYGELLPHRLVKISVELDGSEQSLWRGWLQRIELDWTPAGSATGQQRVRLYCTGAKLLLQAVEVNLPLQQNRRGDEIVAMLLTQVVLPPAVGSVWLADVRGASEADETTVAGAASDYSDLESGITRFRYYGDLREGSAPQDAYRILKDVTEAERGRFFFDRAGRAVWWNRHHLLRKNNVDGVLDSAGLAGPRPRGLDYQFGASLANQVAVTVYPRQLGASLTLWELARPISLAPGEALSLEAPFTDESQQASGAVNPVLAGAVFAAGSASLSLDARADRGIIHLHNSGSQTATLSSLRIEGQPLKSQHRLVLREESADSIMRYGRRQELHLKLRALDNESDARAIALFERYRREYPRGEIRQVTLLNPADGLSNAAQLAWTIGTRLRVLAPELPHEADYFIVGEQHRVSAGGRVHESRFVLEPAQSSSFWLVDVPGYSEADQTTRAAY